MPLKKLTIYNARNISELSLNFHPTYNVLYGANGVGKTTILESIYLLLRARTFRSNKFRNFINIHSEECVIYSTFLKSNNVQDFSLGIRRSKTDKSVPVVHLNTQKISSVATITKLVVLGLITPDSFNLIDSGSSIRRKYIDWGVFHVEHKFLKCWKDYKRVLMNRNSLLKNNTRLSNIQRELKGWDSQLLTLNNEIDVCRKKQINKIKPIFYEILSFFSKKLADKISFTYYQGWNKEILYKNLLLEKVDEDFKAGYTSFGTHRSDIRFLVEKKPAKDILSRGQKKLTVIALILAQFIYLLRNKELLQTDYQHFLLLVDDLDSEIDDTNLNLFFKYLNQFKEIQCFLTTSNPARFNMIEPGQHKMFHVEQLK